MENLFKKIIKENNIEFIRENYDNSLPFLEFLCEKLWDSGEKNKKIIANIISYFLYNDNSKLSRRDSFNFLKSDDFKNLQRFYDIIFCQIKEREIQIKKYKKLTKETIKKFFKIKEKTIDYKFYFELFMNDYYDESNINKIGLSKFKKNSICVYYDSATHNFYEKII